VGIEGYCVRAGSETSGRKRTQRKSPREASSRAGGKGGGSETEASVDAPATLAKKQRTPAVAGEGRDPNAIAIGHHSKTRGE